MSTLSGNDQITTRTLDGLSSIDIDNITVNGSNVNFSDYYNKTTDTTTDIVEGTQLFWNVPRQAFANRILGQFGDIPGGSADLYLGGGPIGQAIPSSCGNVFIGSDITQAGATASVRVYAQNGLTITTSANTFTIDQQKENVITGAATSITGANLTASRALVSDVSGKVSIATTTATELGYVAGATSSIQGQINAITSGGVSHNPVSIGSANGLSIAAGQVLSLGLASGSANGALSSANWTTFNNKENVLTFNAPLSRVGNAISWSTPGSFSTQFDRRNFAPNVLGASQWAVGFGSWANNNTSPYADTLHFNTWSDASGGNENVLMFNKSTIGARVYQGAFNSSTVFSTYRDFVMTDQNSPNVALAARLAVGGLATDTNYVINAGNDTAGVDAICRIRSRRFAGLRIDGDTGNLGGEPGGAYVRLSQDGDLVHGIVSVVQGDNQDGAGGTLTGALNNSLVVASTYSAGALCLGAGNAIRAVISSGGNVGIGTGAPAQALHVSRNTACYLQTENTGGANRLSIGSDGGPQNSIYSRDTNDNARDFRIVCGADERVRFTGGGNVGIGATAPLTRLSISPSTTEAKITLWDGGSSTAHYGFGVSSSQLNYHVSGSGDRHVFYAGGKNGNGTELMRIQGNGNVGIGTASPAVRLHVQGASGELLRISDGTRTLFAGCDSGDPWFGTSTNHPLRLHTNSGEKARITAAGNVGIGTATPASTLHVNGTTTANRINMLGSSRIHFNSGSVVANTNGGLTWHSDESYGIYRTPGAWTANDYQQLRLRWETGIDFMCGNYNRHFRFLSTAGFRAAEIKNNGNTYIAGNLTLNRVPEHPQDSTFKMPFATTVYGKPKYMYDSFAVDGSGNPINITASVPPRFYSGGATDNSGYWSTPYYGRRMFAMSGTVGNWGYSTTLPFPLPAAVRLRIDITPNIDNTIAIEVVNNDRWSGLVAYSTTFGNDWGQIIPLGVQTNNANNGSTNVAMESRIGLDNSCGVTVQQFCWLTWVVPRGLVEARRVGNQMDFMFHRHTNSTNPVWCSSVGSAPNPHGHTFTTGIDLHWAASQNYFYATSSAPNNYGAYLSEHMSTLNPGQESVLAYKLPFHQDADITSIYAGVIMHGSSWFDNSLVLREIFNGPAYRFGCAGRSAYARIMQNKQGSRSMFECVIPANIVLLNRFYTANSMWMYFIIKNTDAVRINYIRGIYIERADNISQIV